MARKLHPLIEGIVDTKKREVAELYDSGDAVKYASDVHGHLSARDFYKALKGSGERPGPRVIAEIKRKTPSLGWIRQRADAREIARLYQECGAAALSVLTDYRYFGGELADLRMSSRTVDLPVMRKDFTTDIVHINQA
jgi:indole-3-glycerol phosphate synthase